ncbi:phiSA1p31-related protein [Streptomyces sp. NPDC002952]|uniref:phiSA1p31-related protein n=1 Tax=Streptomyces sp. NPDC002952 TaxID=3364673 RepID=UPI0036A4F923
MSETYAVGQKVRHAHRGDAEVTYGPFVNPFGQTRYVLRLESGREYYARPDDLAAIPETPKFAVGDVVTLATRAGAKATVEYGPYDGGNVYVVKLVDEPADEDVPRTFNAMAHVMQPSANDDIKVGDRVRVLKDDPVLSTGRFVGKVGTVLSVGGSAREALNYRIDFGSTVWWVADVERVSDVNTYVHEGVTYDLSAKYTDKDGDVWKFARFGDTVTGATIGEIPYEGGTRLSYVVSRWGPLTRV